MNRRRFIRNVSLASAGFLFVSEKVLAKQQPTAPNFKPCLLYTSDAADERTSVDLGGRRIIKKK